MEANNQIGTNAAIQLRKNWYPKTIDELWMKWEAIRQRIDTTVAREAAQWIGAGLQLNASATQIDEDQVSRAERTQLKRDKAKAKVMARKATIRVATGGTQPRAARDAGDATRLWTAS